MLLIPILLGVIVLATAVLLVRIRFDKHKKDREVSIFGAGRQNALQSSSPEHSFLWFYEDDAE